MSVLEEDYLHKFASERFALASATERLFCLSMQSDAPVKHRMLSVSEFARMADNRRANRNSKRNESSSSTGMLFLQKENQDPCDFRAVLMRQLLLLSSIFFFQASSARDPNSLMRNISASPTFLSRICRATGICSSLSPQSI